VVRLPADAKELFFKTCRAALGATHSHIHLQPGIKRSGREAEHSSTVALVKNDWSYTSIRPNALMVFERQLCFISTRSCETAGQQPVGMSGMRFHALLVFS
jgi:hypothetical protein